MKKTILILFLFLSLLLFSFTSLAQIPGDFNEDGKVDFDDLMIFALAYGSTPSSSNWDARCDLHPDNHINFEDLMIFAMNYGKTAEWDSLSGIVTNDVGGPPVEGSTIKVIDIEENEVIAETITDASGEYNIKKIKTGIYDVIASKSDRASSKIQNVKIETNKTTTADIIHFQNNVHGWECVPPTIIVEGIEDGEVCSGILNDIKVKINTHNDLGIKYLFFGVDHIPNWIDNIFYYDYYDFYDQNEIILPELDTDNFPNGEYKIYLVAYDMNYNRSQLSISIIVNNIISGTKPDIPTNVWSISITLGKNAGFFSIERDKLTESNSDIKGVSSFVPLCNDRSIDFNAIINAAPPDSNIVVEITWDSVSYADGYKIYRRFEGEENYQYIGTSVPLYIGFVPSIIAYYDSSPQLAVGRKVYYQVSAFNVYGEGKKSAPNWTTPLAKFNVNLMSPTDGATEVSLIPTLRWQPEVKIGKYQDYYLRVIGKNDSDYVYNDVIYDRTYFTITEPLQQLKVYEWNISSATAYDDWDSDNPDHPYRAISIAGSFNGSLNGSFEFTTGTDP